MVMQSKNEPDENLAVKNTMVFDCLAADECNMAGF